MDGSHGSRQDAVGDEPPAETNRMMRLSSVGFLAVEHGLYIALGLILAVTAVLALTSVVLELWSALGQLSGGEALLKIVDRLLFVLMLAEILHTVRVSIRSGTLTCEPFLIVGLIASIRRVLVITLESSQSTPGKATDPGHMEMFQSSMIELGVLGALILVMVVSIYLVRRADPAGEPVTTD